MSTTTTNFGLLKPDLTDPADITKLNENWDKIDAELLNSEEIFIATANVTTFEELNNAVKKGKTVFCTNGSILMSLTNSSPDVVYQFSCVSNEDNINNFYFATIAKGTSNWSIVSKKTQQYTYGTTDLTAGESALKTGTLYFVYE